jgi:PAT family beta-lactamase induction signal transducer AmpG
LKVNVAAGSEKKFGIGDVFKALGQPRVASLLALGFASGLPFLLTGATFGYWLRDEGTTLTAIGFLSWVGLAYAFKFLWSPLVDRLPAPPLGISGRRRGWVVFAQLLIVAGLVAMAAVGPHGPGGLATIGAAALVVAFASATQDIAVDAWRIEAANDTDELSLLTSAFQLGYRVALLVTDALILIFAQHLGWRFTYGFMALLMCGGLVAALRTPEPARAESVMQQKASAAPLWTWRGMFDALAGPLIEFFRAHGSLAPAMLILISVYRLPEFLIGPVAGPFYHDLGLAKDVVGGIRASVGLIASMLGIAAGGVCAVRLGLQRALVVGALLQGLGVAAYAVVAALGPDLRIFAAAMAGDNFCYAFAGVAFVAYMSSLISLGYTATQYALLSSLYALFGKFLKGFSGAVVDGLAQTHSLMHAYAIFYAGTGAICLPALVLCIFVSARQTRPSTPPPAASQAG